MACRGASLFPWGSFPLTLQLSEQPLENTLQTLHWLPATLGTKPRGPARSHTAAAASQLHLKSLEPRWLCTRLGPLHQCPLCWNILSPTLCTHFSFHLLSFWRSALLTTFPALLHLPLRKLSGLAAAIASTEISTTRGHLQLCHLSGPCLLCSP